MIHSVLLSKVYQDLRELFDDNLVTPRRMKIELRQLKEEIESMEDSMEEISSCEGRE